MPRGSKLNKPGIRGDEEGYTVVRHWEGPGGMVQHPLVTCISKEPVWIGRPESDARHMCIAPNIHKLRDPTEPHTYDLLYKWRESDIEALEPIVSGGARQGALQNRYTGNNSSVNMDMNNTLKRKKTKKKQSKRKKTNKKTKKKSKRNKKIKSKKKNRKKNRKNRTSRRY